jgi:predicted methyltransferase
MKITTLLLSSLLILPAPLMANANNIHLILNALERPQQDKLRDADRKPADILALVDIKPNMTVVDFIAGEGYYSEIFARMLNNSGKLFSVKGKLGKRELQRFHNITTLSKLDLSDLNEPVDRIFTALNYHDIINKKSIDRQKLLNTIYNKLNDSGYLIVIDHNAGSGVGTSQTKKLHRVESTFVLNEIVNAGFMLDRSLSVLANPNDHYATDVWHESTKGKTDRFVYRFTKVIKE